MLLRSAPPPRRAPFRATQGRTQNVEGNHDGENLLSGDPELAGINRSSTNARSGTPRMKDAPPMMRLIRLGIMVRE
jgi:hypothetical protein